jgi:hypothetical protein
MVYSSMCARLMIAIDASFHLFVDCWLSVIRCKRDDSRFDQRISRSRMHLAMVTSAKR